jgi:hypothetical protein
VIPLVANVWGFFTLKSVPLSEFEEYFQFMGCSKLLSKNAELRNEVHVITAAYRWGQVFVK